VIAAGSTRVRLGLLRVIVFALVAASVTLTGAQQLGSDGPGWLELSRYLPFPMMLAPAVLALVLSPWLGRRWVVASAAAVLLFVTVAMGFVWHAAAPAQGSLRVMTYNTKAAQLLERSGGIAPIEREIAAHRPDIVVMQDANGIRHWRGYDPKGPLFGLAHVFAQREYAVASRWPLRDCAVVQVAAGAEPLSYARCSVDADGAAFTLVTVHFESPRLGLNAARREGADGIDAWQRNHETRLAQARALARDLAPGPLVLAGDLNAPDSSAVVGSLVALGLRDAFASAGRGYGYTYGHTLRPGFSFLRIDHILVSPDFAVRDSSVGGDDASDHRPVIADLAWRGARAPGAPPRP
jgi:endonuclease/exonuclease/phosphatase (EEP) superfamily protein YafD